MNEFGMENPTEQVDILSELNPNQRKAVETLDGPVIIIAGAGSGKTKVLTYRIANLIRRGVKPWTILALTFTNKAAKEMKERIAKIVSEDEAKQVVAGTFHSVFARILRREAAAIGYTPNFSIYDTEDSKAVIKNILKEYNLDAKKEFPPNAVASEISGAKNKMFSPSDYYSHSKRLRQNDIIAHVFEEYQRRLLKADAMDFDDLLLNMVKLLRQSEIAGKLQERYRYILVDEYQDTNKVQYQIVKKLAEKYNNICVVGDDSQSIYRWRGADIQNILSFQADYHDAKAIRLEQNYRSTKNIIGAADSLIRHNKGKLEKKLWTENAEGDKIGLRQYESSGEEARRIAAKIDSEIQHSGRGLNDFAVLYRTNAQSLDLERAMKDQELRYQMLSGLPFYARKEVKDVIAYLKLLVNPADDMALQRIINEPQRGLGATSLNHIYEFAKNSNFSYFEACSQVANVIGLQARAVSAVKKFTEFISLHFPISDMNSPFDDIYKYIEETGITDAYKEMGTEDSSDRIRNIDMLMGDVRSFFIAHPDSFLSDYLQQISLQTDADKADLNENSVKLMTLHAAKGLEFPYVFIPGIEQRLLPLIHSEGMSTEDEEEERRLFYVGITRAREHLELSYCRSRFMFGDVKPAMRSSFLNEIDPQFLDEDEIHEGTGRYRDSAFSNITTDSLKHQFGFRKDNDAPRRSAPRAAAAASPEMNTKLPLFLTLKAGDIVNHSIFGPGRVDAISGFAENKTAKITFRSVGTKMLLIRFAKMEIVKKA